MLLIGLFTLALMLLAAPANAMPAVGAAVVAAVAAITWTQVIVAVVSAVVSIGLGYLASALLRPSAQKGAQPQAPKQMIDSKITIKQSTAPRQIIYGEARVGGVMVFSHSNNGNRYLHIIYAIAGHEVSSIDQVWINDEPHWTYESRARAPGDALILNADGFTTAGKTWAVGPAGVNGSFARFKFHNGTDTQTADETIRSNATDGIYDDDIWGPTDRLQGIAYCYARFEFGPTGPLAPLFSDGLPNVTFVVRGKKVLDPRTSTTAWSDNAALCVYDYLTDTRYGIGVDKTTGVDVNSVIAAANACDEQVTLDAGGTENRFTCNGSFKTDEQPQAVLGRLLSSMHGRAPYDGEKWRLIAGVYQAATVSLSDSDLRAGPTVQTLVSRRDRYNAVKGTFVSARDFWQETDFPPLKDATAITNDGAEVWHDIVLPFTNLSSMAQRLAKIELKRGRMEISATLPCKLTAWKAQVGDTIAVTCERYGWNAKTFEVRGSRLSVDGDNHLIGVDLDIAEINSNVYAWTSTEEQPNPGGGTVTPPDAFTVLPVTNLNATEEVYTTTDGTGIKSRLIVDWDASLDAFVSEYQVEYKLQSASTWTVLGRTAETIWTIQDIKPAAYHVRVAAVNRFGLFSTYVQIGVTVSGDTTPPEDVVGFTSASGVSGYTTFNWTAPVYERARAGIAEMRWNAATSGVTWGSATPIVIQSALNTQAIIQTKIGTYLIKYKSANGVYSTNAASATITTTAQVKVGIEIVSSLPTTDLFEGRIVYLSTDDKLYRYTGSAWTTAVPAVDITGSITSTQITDGAISTPKLAANAVTAAKIAANTITASEIASNAITADKILAGAVTAAKINVNQLSAMSADMGTITAGTITGATHQTASSGSVRAVMDTRIMFRCEDPNYSSRTYYRNVGWSEPNIASHIGAEGGLSYSRFLNYGGSTCLDIQSFGNLTTPWINTPGANGIVSRGTNVGVVGYSEANAGVTGAGAIYDFYANGDGSNYGPFTGSHDALIEKATETTIGDIVVDVELVAQKSVSNAITRVEPSSSANQRGALGVVCKRMDVSHNMPPAALSGDPVPGIAYPVIDEAYAGYIDTHDRLLVNAVGEGLINVCGQGGDIAIGDLIVTSDTAGKGMRQADDIIRGYTVAKARETATFATAGEVKTIACIYVSG